MELKTILENDPRWKQGEARGDNAELSDQEFAQLEQEIQNTQRRLDELQRLYRRQTGQDYRSF